VFSRRRSPPPRAHRCVRPPTSQSRQPSHSSDFFITFGPPSRPFCALPKKVHPVKAFLKLRGFELNQAPTHKSQSEMSLRSLKDRNNRVSEFVKEALAAPRPEGVARAREPLPGSATAGERLTPTQLKLVRERGSLIHDQSAGHRCEMHAKATRPSDAFVAAWRPASGVCGPLPHANEAFRCLGVHMLAFPIEQAWCFTNHVLEKCLKPSIKHMRKADRTTKMKDLPFMSDERPVAPKLPPIPRDPSARTPSAKREPDAAPS
jgi:hypothetical protein